MPPFPLSFIRCCGETAFFSDMLSDCAAICHYVLLFISFIHIFASNEFLLILDIKY